MKLRDAASLLLLLLLLAGEAAAQTIVEGTVALPKPRAAPVLNKRYSIVAMGGVLAPYPPVAIVYLEGSFPKPATRPVRQMAQKGLAFVPTLLPVEAGTRVEFPNLDDTYHNVFSYSEPKRFDLGRYRSDEKPVPSEVFDAPGLVTLRCDIHEHMRGLILVVPTPYFTVSGTDGRYRLEGLPAGHYALKAWVDSGTTRVRPVDLRPGATLRADFP